MSIIRAKTICEKVDLFIKVADEDGNGSLSWSEIIKLCRISLVRYFHPNIPGSFPSRNQMTCSNK
jgi:hypothetical protein